MKLTAFEYNEFAGTPDEWHLHRFQLADINLVVGKNATGKSRTLAVINSLAALMRGETKWGDARWTAEFENEGRVYRYELRTAKGFVEEERLDVNMVSMLERRSDGTGQIAVGGSSSEKVEFEIPKRDLAVVAKRDKKQHPILEPLHQWARSLRFYSFGTPMGRDRPAIFHETGRVPEVGTADDVVGLFARGIQEFPSEFKSGVIRYMSRIGYNIQDIKIVSLDHALVAFGDTSSEPLWEAMPRSVIALKERDLKGDTRQPQISQGMFRAFSIIVQLHYAELIKAPSSMLIDDIGEGLDFERSAGLIELLIDRATANQVQLVMSTNDRFVMNTVPLEDWAVLVRKGSDCHIYNYANAKDHFEEFKLTGLNNFDLFRENIFHDGAISDEAGNLR